MDELFEELMSLPIDDITVRQKIEDLLTKAYDVGYDLGFDEGNTDGYNDGYSEGHTCGYDDGYESARDEFEDVDDFDVE